VKKKRKRDTEAARGTVSELKDGVVELYDGECEAVHPIEM